MFSLRGALKDPDVMVSLCGELQQHPRIAHLDLAENQLQPANLTALLRRSSSLMCVHFDFSEGMLPVACSLNWNSDNYGLKVAWRALHVKSMGRWALDTESACWICRRCMATHIAWKGSEASVHLRPSWCNYAKLKMERSGNIFSTTELVPPGKHHFYFEGRKPFVADHFPIEPSLRNDIMSEMNTLESKPFILPEETVEGMETLENIGSFLFPKVSRVGVTKTKLSIRREYLLRQCFNADCARFDFATICPNDEEIMRKLIWSRYNELYDMFMTYHGRNKINDFVDDLKKTYRGSTNAEFVAKTFEKIPQDRGGFIGFLLQLSVELYPEIPVSRAFGSFVDHTMPALYPPWELFSRSILGHEKVVSLFMDYTDVVSSAHISSSPVASLLLRI